MLVSNVVGGIEISVQLVSTSTTTEKRLSSTIGPGLKSTPRTSLRSVPRVNSHHASPCFLGFVGKKVAELSESPAMQPAARRGFLLDRGVSSNLGQVLNHEGCAWDGTPHNPFGQNVVAIPLKPCQSSFQLSQMPFGRRVPACGCPLDCKARLRLK